MRRIRAVRELGRGGLGRTVQGEWLDAEPGARGELAFKILRRASDARRAILRHEFFALRQLGHPNLVRALDYGWFELHEAGTRTRELGIVLELVSGTSLGQFGAAFADVRVPLADALEALASMHRQGFAHGDVKPDNVLVRADGTGVLLDLSAASPLGSGPSGERTGTPTYLAPEAGTVAVGPALDVFAVGRTLDVLGARLGGLPAAVRDWVQAALDPEPAARPLDLDALLEALRGPTPRSAREPFVPRLAGRRELLRSLEASVHGALDGRSPPVLCVTGPPGAGRTRLLAELRWALAERAELRSIRDRHDGTSALLHALASGERTVLLADEPDLDLRAWLELVADELERHPGIVLVLAGQAPLACRHEPFVVQPLSLAQAEELFPSSFPRTLIEHAHRRARGLPGPLVALAKQIDTFRPTTAAVDRVLDASHQRAFAAPPLPADPLSVARALRFAGQAERALPLVCRALRRRRGDASALRVEAAACMLARGHATRARAILARVTPSADCRDMALEVEAELALKSARYPRALELAQTPVSDPVVRWSLAITRAAALVILDAEAAEAAVADARAFTITAPRLAYRLLSTEALLLHRRGDSAAAEATYARAAELVESERLDDLRATASYNLATAAEQSGKLGLALETYERTVLLSRLTGATATDAPARFALANLLFELGHRQRARTHAHATLARAEAAGLGVLASLTLTLLAETAAPAERSAAFARARAALPVGTEEGAEALDIALAEARSEPETAAPIRELVRWAERLRSVDLLARALVLVPLDDARADRLEALLQQLGSHSSRFRVLDLHERLHAIYTHQRAWLHAREHATRAVYEIEALLAQLPAALREPLARRAAKLRAPQSEPHAAAASAGQAWPEEITQLLDVQRRLSAAADVDQLLGAALDCAIVLAGAERGFVVLDRERGALDVRAARNLDANKLSGRELSFSRSVVREVIASQDARFAVRAEGDEFLQKQRSVHAQKLRAVVVLPFATARGTRGALYLDNRFVATTPSARAREVLLFLRDQIAAALDHALLTHELAERNRELERKSLELELLLDQQRRELERRRDAAASRRTARATAGKFPRIVGQSEPMVRALALLERIAPADVTVLVEGESGTGKELFARALHEESARSSAPFVALNCGAMPEALLEAELFGASKGAFTGAVRETRGLFVAADGGTLFLDEIGEMPLSMQVKLLRVLQQREVRALGKDQAVPIDIRVVTATHRSLDEEVRAGRFREDLFFRLAVVRLHVPPLRERGTDVVTLADVILDREAARLGLPRPQLAPSALRALMQHKFPGNVRELENVLTKALVLGGAGDALEAEHLGLPEGPRVRARRADPDAERRAIEAALEATGGNVVQAAKRLGMPRATFYRKLARHARDKH